MAGEVSFFEIGAGDTAKAREFYSSLFGWRFEEVGSEGGLSISGSSVPGGVHGGDAGASVYVFFSVKDMDAAVARVRELGGDAQGIESDDDDPGNAARYGRFMLCTDDQGSSFGLHQPPG